MQGRAVRKEEVQNGLARRLGPFFIVRLLGRGLGRELPVLNNNHIYESLHQFFFLRRSTCPHTRSELHYVDTVLLDTRHACVDLLADGPGDRHAIETQKHKSSHLTPPLPFAEMAPAAERRTPNPRKVTRSRLGCETCRARKVRCDERPGGCKFYPWHLMQLLSHLRSTTCIPPIAAHSSSAMTPV